MAAEAPHRLLEINIISAHDLPPVSKMLRTFVVAYIHPDQKLTTKIDHHGHTNPTWNYKVSFHIDEKFLKQENAAVMIEIYNLAWLRNLPIGTTSLHVGNMSPPLQKNAPLRKVALQVSRPSGHLQGTMHVGVQLIDNIVDVSDGCSPSISAAKTEGGEDQDVPNGEGLYRDYMRQENTFLERKNSHRGDKLTTMIDQTLQDKTSEFTSISPPPESRRVSNMPDSEPEPELEPEPEPEPKPEPEMKPVNSSGNSLFSAMRPIPSDVALKLKKGLYSAGSGSYGSSVLEGWSDARSDDLAVKPPPGQQWLPEDPIPMITTDNIGPQWQPDDPAPATKTNDDADIKKKGKHLTKRPEKKKGLMSCFGNAYGLEFSFICGSKAMKNKNKSRNGSENGSKSSSGSKSKKKNRNVDKQNVQFMTVPEENLRGFYV